MARGNLFFGSLLIVTALPLLGLPIAFAAGLDHAGELVVALSVVANAIGVGHVASSSFVYLDSEFAPVLRRSPWRFFAAILIIPIAAFLFFSAPASIAGPGMAAFVAWNLYHFQRQNYGLAALAAASTGFGRLPSSASRMLNLAAAAGSAAILSVPAIYPAALAHSPMLAGDVRLALRLLAFTLYGAAAIDFALMLAREPRLRGDRRLLLFLSIGFVFFLPALFSGAMLLVFWPFAVAHSLQYYVMGGISAAGARWRRGILIWSLATIATTIALLYLLGSAVLWPLYIGLTICHFLIDARVWKLREDPQRSIIRRRFAFVFAASTTSPEALRSAPLPTTARTRPQAIGHPMRLRG